MTRALVIAAAALAVAGCGKTKSKNEAPADSGTNSKRATPHPAPDKSGPSRPAASGIGALGSPKSEVRLRTVRRLAKNPPTDPAVIAEIVAFLGHDDPGVRLSAATALTYVKNAPSTTAPLVEALSDSDELVRFQALKALARRGDPAALDGLVATLSHADKVRRAWAVGALGKLGEPARAHVDKVLPLLADKQVAVRLQAIRAVGRLGDKTAVEPLLDAASGGSVIRAQVTRALGDLAIDERTRAAALARLAKRYGKDPDKKAGGKRSRAPR